MHSDRLPSRSRLIIALALWFAIWFLMQWYAVQQISGDNWMAFTDAGISLGFILVGISILFILQRYTGAYLNRPPVRAAFMVAIIAEIIYFQKLILTPYYASTAFPFMVDDTWLIRIIVAFSQVTFFSVVLWLMNYIKRQTEKAKLQQEADNLFRQAELTRLRQQLQPHFLFNSLNSINSLVMTDPQKARQMVLNLSDFLRGTLKEDESKTVPLREEMEVLKLYLEIEKVRFGHRLEVQFDVEDDALKMLIPPLLIQPVLENAIKFGLYNMLDQVLISVRAVKEKGMLKIEVTNPCSAETEKLKKGSGFGLNMIQRRLHLLYHRTDLVKAQRNGDLFSTTLLIPQV
ncbi:MAG: histidine kinase [Bacteroidetes bacterium]|nr:histidine kinase [Bacteroidota bacterium]